MARYELDLSQAEQALKRTDDLSKLLKKSLREISQEFQQIGKTNVDASGKLIGYSDALEKRGVRSLKEFRTEQRTQNFVIREGTQAVTNMVFALGFLSQGQKGASETTKNVTSALMAGVAAQNAVEFSMFSLGRASLKLGGPMGKLISSFSRYGGLIGMAVGVGASLVTLFDRSAEAAEHAARMQTLYNNAIKLFVEGIGKEQAEKALEISKVQSAINQKHIDELQAAIDKEREELHLKKVRGDATVKEIKEFAGREAILEQRKREQAALQANIDGLQSYVDAINQVEAVRNREKGAREEHVKSLYAEFQAGQLVVKTWQEVLRARGAASKTGPLITPGKAEPVDIPKIKTIQDILREMHEEELELQRQMANNFSLLQQGMAAIGVAGDSVIGRLMTAIQFAIQLSQAIAMMNAGTAGPLGFLGPIGAGLGILGALFGLGRQSGGWTGPGPANRDADEVVFEKSIVERNRADLLTMRRAMQSGKSVQQAAISTGPGLSGIRFSTRSLEREMKAVRDAIEDLPNVMQFDPTGIARFLAKDERRGLSKRLG